jgi:hypothetical protein
MSSAIRPFISGVGYGPHRIAQSRSGGKVVVENGSAHDEAMDDGSARKSGHSATAWRWIKSTCSSSSSKGFGFRIRKLAAILTADVVGFSPPTGADEDRTLASQPCYRGAGPLAMTPRLVRTNQSPPRFSIRNTRPAPGIKSPGATSCGP